MLFIDISNRITEVKTNMFAGILTYLFILYLVI